MPKTTPPREAPTARLQKLAGRLARSRLAGWVANLPPIAWATRVVARTLAKREITRVSVPEAPIERVVGTGLEATLQQIVRDVVDALGYIGTGVAIYEPDGSLPLRAFYFDPHLINEDQVLEWERRVSEIMGKPFSISDPDIARVFVYQDEFKDNLSVQAVKAREPVKTDELYDLFAPVVPTVAKPIIEGIQEAVGVGKLIAIPFFLETVIDGKPTKEIVGNLFAGTRSKSFSSGEIELLKAFGQQAAAGIRNARLYNKTEELYRKAEERRQAAEIFAKMAFNAAASVHALRNHVGAFRTHLQLLQLMPPERLPEILESSPEILTRLDEAANILDNLPEPWRETPDVRTDINTCFLRAIEKVIPDRDGIEAREGIVVHESLSKGLPPIRTSPDMLTEALKVLVKNAVEAIREKGQGGDLWVESYRGDNSVIEILIRDNGIGIKPENLSKIFEMRWSTKDAGMGFGLFWTKDYIEGLGGSIKVQSVWQEETTFRVSLPASND
jgi:signal transduction histidine kinase